MISFAIKVIWHQTLHVPYPLLIQWTLQKYLLKHEDYFSINLSKIFDKTYLWQE